MTSVEARIFSEECLLETCFLSTETLEDPRVDFLFTIEIKGLLKGIWEGVFLTDVSCADISSLETV